MTTWSVLCGVCTRWLSSAVNRTSFSAQCVLSNSAKYRVRSNDMATFANELLVDFAILLKCIAHVRCRCLSSLPALWPSLAAPETDCYWCKQSISHPYTKRTANTHHTEINVRRSGFSAKCRVQKSCHKLKSSANIERRMCISITLSRYPRSVCKQQQCTPYMTGEWVGLGMHYAWRTGTSSIAIVCGDASTTACFA